MQDNITTQAQGVDAFTLRHLAEWVDMNAHYDDRENFTAWALETLARDASLVDLGWNVLHRAWLDEIMGR